MTNSTVSLQWQAISLTVIEKVQIAAAILGSLFLMASISWLVWSSFSPSARWQRQDLLFQICYGMYGFMDVVCIGERINLYCVDLMLILHTCCTSDFMDGVPCLVRNNAPRNTNTRID